MQHRRSAFALIIFAAVSLAGMCTGLAAGTVEMWRADGCNCCGKWAAYMKANGYAVEVNDVAYQALQRIKAEAGLAKPLRACHTAKVGGYVIEGHVPAQDVARLLDEKPDAVGLSVPGMPAGSPGMEQGGKSEPYDVLLVKHDGTTEVFASH